MEQFLSYRRTRHKLLTEERARLARDLIDLRDNSHYRDKDGAARIWKNELDDYKAGAVNAWRYLLANGDMAVIDTVTGNIHNYYVHENRKYYECGWDASIDDEDFVQNVDTNLRFFGATDPKLTDMNSWPIVFSLA